MALDREAFEFGYDDGWIGREPMSWKEFTFGNPGFNRAFGSYKKGYEKAKNDKANNLHDPFEED
jgi:hypothetical protein